MCDIRDQWVWPGCDEAAVAFVDIPSAGMHSKVGDGLGFGVASVTLLPLFAVLLAWLWRIKSLLGIALKNLAD